jgi:large subunit ribosomal protein L13
MATNKVQVKQFEFDADGQILGRLASKVAQILQGKTIAAYEPRLVGSAVVIVKNAAKIKVSGNKATDKVYYHHTGFQGHLREQIFKEFQAKDPRKIIEFAVYNMLPKNRLRPSRMKRLKITA